jgi:hypothetical protein
VSHVGDSPKPAANLPRSRNPSFALLRLMADLRPLAGSVIEAPPEPQPSQTVPPVGLALAGGNAPSWVWPAVIWGVTALTVLTFAPAGSSGARGVAAAAAVVAVLVLRRNPRQALLTLLSLAPFVSAGGARSAAWALGAVGLTLAIRGPGVHAFARADLHRHLAAARRREVACDMLVIRPLGGPSGDRLARILRVLRATDSAELRPLGLTGRELQVLFEDVGSAREAVEERLDSRAGGGMAFGWARFPDDGLTVEVLAKHAGARTTAQDSSTNRQGHLAFARRSP